MNLVLVSSLLGLPVHSLHEQTRLGTIHKILFNTNTGHVAGFVIKNHMLDHPRALQLDDIISLDRSSVVIQKETAVVPIEDDIRAHEIYKEGFTLIGLPIKTKSGKRIGKVSDISLSLDYGMIVSLYTNAFLTERIIHHDAIIEITKKAVIIQDEELPSKALPDTQPVK